MQKRKGFTLVELVIVIAVIAILAGVLIGTFASVINRANESADIQKIKSEEIAQKADDIIKKIEESDWFGWEDFEAEIVAELTKVYKANNTSTTGLTQNDVTTAVTSAMTTYFANNKVEVSNTMLTAEQVKAIVENALGTLKYEGVTEAQVKAALKEALAPELYSTLKAEQVKGIVETANANNLTAAQLASAVASLATSTSVDQLYTNLTAKLSGAVTEIKDYAAAFATKDDVKQAVDSAIAQAMEIHQDSDPVILAKAFNIRILKAKANNLNTIYDILVAIGATNDVDSLTIPGLFFDLDRKEFFVSATEKKYNVPSTDTYKWWTFVENGTVDSYSTYLLGNASYDTINLNGVGLDVGQTTVTTINYSWDTEPGHTVVIRTNGGTLTVDAKNDTVQHYGYAEAIDIQKVAMSSYDEHGTVPFIKIAYGHVEIASDGWANAIHLVNKNETSFDEIKVSVKSNDMPKFSREPITINTNQEVKVCIVEVERKTQVIYLTQQGIYEQVKVAEVIGTEIGTSTFIEGTPNSSKMNTVADQVSNNVSGEKGTDYTIDEITRELTIIDDVNAEVTESGVASWQSQAASAFVGTGTKEDPFQIYDYATFQKVSTMYEEGYKYFKVKDGVTTIDCTGWAPVYLNGSFDGNGVTLKNVTAILFQNVGSLDNTNDILVNNFTAELNIAPDPSNPYSTGAMIKNIGNAGKTTLKDITLHGVVEGYCNLGSFYNYGPTNLTNGVYTSFSIELNNCKSDVTLIDATGNSVGGLLGHSYTNASHQCTLTVIDSEYTGRAYLAGTAKLYTIGGYGGDSSTFYNCYTSINGETPSNQNKELVGQYGYITKVTPVKGENEYSIAKQVETSKVIVSICTQFTSYDNEGQKILGLSGITGVKRIAEITDISSSNIKVLDKFTSVEIHNEDGISNVVNGVLHIYNGEGYENIDGTIRLQVNQYKANGEYVSAGTIEIATKTGVNGSWIVK